MIKAEIVLTAWDKTLETRDFRHLSAFFRMIFSSKIRLAKSKIWQLPRPGVSRAKYA